MHLRKKIFLCDIVAYCFQSSKNVVSLMCDTPFGTVNWKGGHNTGLTKHNTLFITVNMELVVEWVDLNKKR